MKIDSTEQFDRLLAGLGSELMWANVIYDMFLGLNASFVEYKNEVNASAVFWGVARDAIREKATLALCRVYDADYRTNSLPNLLIQIRDNPILSHVKEATEDEPRKAIDGRQLELDIEFATVANPSIKRLVQWRSSSFVHRNASRVATLKPLKKEQVPMYSDIESLLKGGLKIINRYAGHFKSTEYSAVLPSANDFTYVLESVREKLNANRRRYAEELIQFGLDPKQYGLDD